MVPVCIDNNFRIIDILNVNLHFIVRLNYRFYWAIFGIGFWFQVWFLINKKMSKKVIKIVREKGSVFLNSIYFYRVRNFEIRKSNIVNLVNGGAVVDEVAVGVLDEVLRYQGNL